MPLGDFSPSNMPGILANLTDMTNDSRVSQRHNLMPDFGILKVIKEQIETANYARVRPDDRSCEKFTVTWLEESDTKATVSTGQTMLHRHPCSIDGEELMSNKKEYILGKSVKYTVAIHDEDCGNMFDFESKVALALLQGQKKLVAAWAQALVGYLYAGAGANKMNGIVGMNGQIGTADITDPVTLINSGDLVGDKSIPYLSLLAKLNKLQNPYLIDGGMFFFDQFKSAVEAGTYAGSKYWALSRYELDLINFMEAGFMNNSFVVDQGSWSLPVVSFFPELGGDNEVVADKYIYSAPLAGLTLNGQSVPIDWTYTKEEETLSAGRCGLFHKFNMELKFDMWQAPRYASDTVTGTIALRQQAA